MPDRSFRHDPTAPIFFISYAWAHIPGSPEAEAIKYEYVLELYNDLSSIIAEMIPLEVGQQPGFLDRQSMTGGDPWSEAVVDAVSRCQVFVPLLTSTYPAREWCEREWQTFAARRTFDKTTGRETNKTGILPVSWIPPGPMPEYISKIGRFVPTGLPTQQVEQYRENGLYGLARAFPETFRAVSWKLAQRIWRTWHELWTELDELPQTREGDAQ